ncbi:MAG: hypothetical protein LBQ34_05035 [Alphaproteobacteria bacterium]|jgi:hypothetical protein|nr:hypothetical protein [Alphaproteobacteria bacterium]
MENNLLKSATEYYTLEATDTDYKSAVNMLLYKLRGKVAENQARIIIKMEAVSFVLNSQQPIEAKAKLLAAFNKDKQKYLFNATIGVEIKYLKIPFAGEGVAP